MTNFVSKSIILRIADNHIANTTPRTSTLYHRLYLFIQSSNLYATILIIITYEDHLSQDDNFTIK